MKASTNQRPDPTLRHLTPIATVLAVTDRQSAQGHRSARVRHCRGQGRAAQKLPLGTLDHEIRHHTIVITQVPSMEGFDPERALVPAVGNVVDE